jgi:hypothetical protein
MPEVMLPVSWPNTFRRTVAAKHGKSRVMEFQPGVPVDLKPNEVELLKADIGVALMPIHRDEKGRPRVIREDVEPVESVADDAQGND